MQRFKIWGVLGVLTLVLVCFVGSGNNAAAAVDCSNVQAQPLNITVQPAGKRLNLKPGQVYEDSFIVKNAGCNAYDFTVKAEPFYPEEGGDKFSYETQNKWTQLSRFISFSASSYHLEPGEQASVNYKITVPSNTKIAGGGQYAAIGISAADKNTASVQSIQRVMYQIYAQMEGKPVRKSSLTSQKINWFNLGDTLQTSFRVKNEGNVDSSATGSIEVKGIFGNIAYATPQKDAKKVSVFPETETNPQYVNWENARPGFYLVKQAVSLDGQNTKTAHFTFVMPYWQLILLVITIVLVVLAFIKSRQKTVKTKRYEKIEPFKW